MIDESDVRIEAARGGSKTLWHRATHIPSGVVVEGEFKSGRELLEVLKRAVYQAQKT